VLNPGANVGGNTRIGDGAVLGMSATVVNGVEVGAGAVVAAGAVVVRPVEPQTRVQGVPARVFSPA
jgi:acetyltransferase-like isoleucine patch superfamily enzyme